MLLYQYHNQVLGVMNSFDYEKLIELSEDSLYIVETLIQHQIPVLSFANIFNARYLHCYAGTIKDLLDCCEQNQIVLKDTNKSHRGMYIPFSNGYEKYNLQNKSSCQSKLKMMEMQLVPTREMFEPLGLKDLWENYANRKVLEFGNSK